MILNHYVVYHELNNIVGQLYFKNKLIEKEWYQICGYQRQGIQGAGNWMKMVKRYKLLDVRYISTRNVMYNTINIIRTAICYMWTLKRVNPKKSYHREKYFFYFFCIYMRWEMLTKLINYCINNFMMYFTEIIMLHTNLQSCLSITSQ